MSGASASSERKRTTKEVRHSSTPSKAAVTAKVVEPPKTVKKVCVINSREHFENQLTEAGNKLIMVEFFAEWCGPCKLIGTKLEEWAEMYDEKAIILKIDVDDFEELAIEYNVVSMPTFLFLKNKQKIEQIVGSDSERVFQSLEKYCGSPKKVEAAETNGK